MKKTYNKPKMKTVRLLAAESLMTVSGDSVNIKATTYTATGDEALSNQESEHDIWGNDDSSMWK